MKSDINAVYQDSLIQRSERQEKENAAFADWLSRSPENSAALADSCEKAASSMRAKRERAIEKEMAEARTNAESEVLKRRGWAIHDKHQKNLEDMAKSFF